MRRANACTYPASEEAGFATGQVLHVIGGHDVICAQRVKKIMLGQLLAIDLGQCRGAD